LSLFNPARIDSDVVTVRILNRDEMLTEEDMKKERIAFITNWKKRLDELRIYSFFQRATSNFNPLMCF
jgi:hypothetical protein